jgi:hypothetical protein
MRGPRETINATMLATAIRIDARFKSDIGTLIARDDRFGRVAEKLRRARWSIFGVRVDIDNIDIAKIDMKLFETIRRIAGGAAPACYAFVGTRFFVAIFAIKLFARLKIVLGHVISSSEHIALSSEILAGPARKKMSILP